MPAIDARVAALEIAFVELSKFLGRNHAIQVIQLATVLKDAARVSKANEETTAAVAELARKLG